MLPLTIKKRLVIGAKQNTKMMCGTVVGLWQEISVTAREWNLVECNSWNMSGTCLQSQVI
jgi:hypothetical protein